MVDATISARQDKTLNLKPLYLQALQVPVTEELQLGPGHHAAYAALPDNNRWSQCPPLTGDATGKTYNTAVLLTGSHGIAFLLCGLQHACMAHLKEAGTDLLTMLCYRASLRLPGAVCDCQHTI